MLQRLARSIKQFLTAIVLLVLTIIGAEVVLQFRQPPSVRTVAPSVSSKLQSWLSPSATVHHEMRRLENDRAGQGVPFSTNTLGLRGPEPSASRPADSIRILILGDETVTGIGLQDQDTLSSRLSEFLTKATNHTVEVINAGVPGYCPLLSWLQYRHDLRQLSPDIVILHFDMTDVAEDAGYRRQLRESQQRQICTNPLLVSDSSSTPVSSLLRRSALVKLIRNETGLLSDSSSDAGVRNPVRQYEWTIGGRSDLRLQIQHAMSPVDRLASAAKQDGFQLIVCSTPAPWQVTSADAFPELSARITPATSWPLTEDLPYQILQAVCDKSDIPFCNAATAFRSFSQPAKLFHTESCHLSAYGSALYAREIASSLLQTPVIARLFSHPANISAQSSHFR